MWEAAFFARTGHSAMMEARQNAIRLHHCSFYEDLYE
jgi:hypothetical protein